MNTFSNSAPQAATSQSFNLETADLENPEFEITIRWSALSTARPYTARVTGPKPRYSLEFCNPQALLQHLEWLIRPRPEMR